ncbi:dienelactone hydrolase family protein [Asticcacaulis sp. BYS171W]|uniref:Dienelactone hydrolase family protein n=1 Tax=Asticcacaulis aquaticus TaxID=2984212 RepID=A0ABT5HQ93_9CAUL|nr:dienelactone hydrolase family protein [Asticcacaulis aquaticus]MDC7682243.1 dienelactone hydrolase family protein [Asticcacaulis aquaticus]
MKTLVIFLHGVGSEGAALIGLARHWAQTLPDAVFEAPDGPEPFDMSPHVSGHQWFSVKGVTAENRAARVAAARPAFDATITTLMAKHGIDDPAQVALVGFSQGSIMALDAIATGRWPVAAVVAFSGRLSTPDPLTPSPTPVLLIHGRDDDVIPYNETEGAAHRLSDAGLMVEAHILDGLTHSINASGSRLASAFLVRAWTAGLQI